MKVTVYPRGGKLYIRYTIPGTRKTKRFSTGFENNPYGKEQAEIKAQEIRLSLLLKKDHRLTNRLSLEEAYEVFITNRKKRTIHTANYEYTYDELVRFGNKDNILSRFDEDFFLDFKLHLKTKGLSHNTIVNYLNHSRTMFKFFADKKWIDQNPVIKLSSIKMPIVVITKEHLKSIFKYFKEINLDYYNYLKMLYLSGFRRTEATTVKRKDLLFERKKINLYNSKENRWDLFPMIRGLDKFLSSYKSLDPEEFLFPISPIQATKYFRQHMSKLNLSYTLHDFRRTFGTEEAKNYMPADLMKLMRHLDIKTTLEYYIDGSLDNFHPKSTKPGVKV